MTCRLGTPQLAVGSTAFEKCPADAHICRLVRLPLHVCLAPLYAGPSKCVIGRPPGLPLLCECRFCDCIARESRLSYPIGHGIPVSCGSRNDNRFVGQSSLCVGGWSCLRNRTAGFVIPAKAGTQSRWLVCDGDCGKKILYGEQHIDVAAVLLCELGWVPASAGMTEEEQVRRADCRLTMSRPPATSWFQSTHPEPVEG